MSGKARIGFVGIGNMGWPMAANVARAGFPLTVFDSDRARAARFAAEFGAKAASSPADLGRASDIVITMLPTGAVVRAALMENEIGALAAGAPQPRRTFPLTLPNVAAAAGIEWFAQAVVFDPAAATLHTSAGRHARIGSR